ncbi:hypothetical protein ACFL2K_04135, partial [Candidatus Margulisiibacteriota bacterium]
MNPIKIRKIDSIQKSFDQLSGHEIKKIEKTKPQRLDLKVNKLSAYKANHHHVEPFQALFRILRDFTCEEIKNIPINIDFIRNNFPHMKKKYAQAFKNINEKLESDSKFKFKLLVLIKRVIENIPNTTSKTDINILKNKLFHFLSLLKNFNFKISHNQNNNSEQIISIQEIENKFLINYFKGFSNYQKLKNSMLQKTNIWLKYKIRYIKNDINSLLYRKNYSQGILEAHLYVTDYFPFFAEKITDKSLNKYWENNTEFFINCINFLDTLYGNTSPDTFESYDLEAEDMKRVVLFLTDRLLKITKNLSNTDVILNILKKTDKNKYFLKKIVQNILVRVQNEELKLNKILNIIIKTSFQDTFFCFLDQVDEQDILKNIDKFQNKKMLLEFLMNKICETYIYKDNIGYVDTILNLLRVLIEDKNARFIDINFQKRQNLFEKFKNYRLSISLNDNMGEINIKIDELLEKITPSFYIELKEMTLKHGDNGRFEKIISKYKYLRKDIFKYFPGRFQIRYLANNLDMKLSNKNSMRFYSYHLSSIDLNNKAIKLFLIWFLLNAELHDVIKLTELIIQKKELSKEQVGNIIKEYVIKSDLTNFDSVMCPMLKLKMNEKFYKDLIKIIGQKNNVSSEGIRLVIDYYQNNKLIKDNELLNCFKDS